MIGKTEIAALIAMLSLPIALPADAHPSEQRQAGRRLLIAQRAESGGTGEGAWRLLHQPMDLPDLPKYTGQAQFVQGLMYPNKAGGAAITMSYRAKETPDVVLGWYSDALANYHWKIAPSKSTTMIKAVNGKNGITVNVGPGKAIGGYKTAINISFKLANK